MLDPNSFARDEVTELLENRFSGQGHRAELRRKRVYDQSAEDLDIRFGEERGRYLRERGRAPPATSFSNGGRGDRVPAARNAANTPRDPNRARAPSPRSFGRTRFLHGQVINQHGPSTPNGTNGAGPSSSPSGFTHAHPSRQNGSTPAVTAEGPSLFQPQAAAAMRNQSPSSRSNLSASTQSRRSKGKGKGFKDLKNPEKFNVFKPLKTTTPNIRPSLINPAADAVYYNKALWHAANPGLECDVYHERFPERKSHLEWAVKFLIQEIILLVRNGDSRDLVIYIETHPDRKWMLDAAKQAKELVENSTKGEIQTYCEENPTQEGFIKFAESHFAPRLPRQDSVVAMEVDVPATTTGPSSGPVVPPETEFVMADAHTGMTASVAAQTAGFTVAEANNEPHVQSTAQDSMLAMAAALEEARSSSSAPISGMQAHGTTRSSKSPSNAASSLPTPVKGAQVNGITHYSNAPGAGDPSAASAAQEVVESRPDNQGRLTATFYSVAGDFIGVHQRSVQAPVMATLSFAAQSPAYDPTELISQIDQLAQSMVERSTGTQGARLVAYDSDDEEL